MKTEILKAAKEAREQEIIGYQINIDNYRLAIPLATDPDLAEFKATLEKLLKSEIIEQKKAQIMLDVINMQL